MPAVSLAPRSRTTTLALVALALALVAGSVPPVSLERAADGYVSVIVRGVTASEARDAVTSVGGDVLRNLPIADSVSARVARRDLPALSSLPQVWSVSPDARVAFLGTGDPSSVTHRVQKIVRSETLWNEGVTGAGVGVAVLDTGIYAAHPDLQGRVIHCEDFSHEGRVPTR